MSIMLAFLAVIAVIVGWWLSKQRLMSKPWLETGLAPVAPGHRATPPATAGLRVFLAVVGGLFALFSSAFVMRTGYADWQPVPMPPVIWVNTLILVLSSICLHVAVRAARRGDAQLLHLSLGAGGLSALAFLAGQLVAWRALMAGGYFLADNPANSFFYLITGLHGLHILGGLIGLGRVWLRLGDGASPARVRLGVELCATYWHFLLGVWIALLAVMLGWAGELIEICRAALT
ncbi:MAG TPA: cytochrome c oxidase subunit 3 [Paracoccaceae bacterium]